MDAGRAKRMERVFKRVLPGIKPGKGEARANISNINRITSLLKGIVADGVEIRVVGSLAKNTNLSGTADIDIFLLFDRTLSKDAIAAKGLIYGKALARREKARLEVRYAEHPYARIYFDSLGIKLDLVPAYRLRNISERGTAVDRSPLHTEFINKSLNDRQRDDVRLLKYLLKAHNIYGAEVKTRGFSGYLCELLIYQHDSLTRLLEYFSDIRLPLCMQPLRKAISKDADILKKFNSDFVVIDPVDPERNVAAGVSKESLARFAIIAKQFVTEPSERMFFSPAFKTADSHDLMKRFADDAGLDIHLITIRVSDKSEDTIWPQLKRYSEIVRNHVEYAGFQVMIDYVWVSGTKGFVMLLTPKASMRLRLLKGPKIFSEYYVMDFLKRHKDAHGFIVKDDSVFALERSVYRTPKEAIGGAIKSRNPLKSKDLYFTSARLGAAVPKGEAVNAYFNLLNNIRI